MEEVLFFWGVEMCLSDCECIHLCVHFHVGKFTDGVALHAYRNAEEIDDHEHQVNAAAQLFLTNGPYLGDEDAPNGAT